MVVEALCLVARMAISMFAATYTCSRIAEGFGFAIARTSINCSSKHSVLSLVFLTCNPILIVKVMDLFVMTGVYWGKNLSHYVLSRL